MRTVTRILPFEIGEIARGNVEPLRQQRRDQERYGGLRAQECGGIVDFVDGRAADGTNGRRMGLLKQSRHLADDGARLGDICNDSVAFEDFKRALDEDEQMTGRTAFANNDGSRGQFAFLALIAIVENGAHPSSS